MPADINLSVRIPEKLHARTRMCAGFEGISMNAYLVRELAASVERDTEKIRSVLNVETWPADDSTNEKEAK